MSRELDAVIAEKIFDRPSSYYHCPHFDKDGRILSFCSCPDLPRYSRDIAAAMQVEERIKELGLIDEYCMHLNDIASMHVWYAEHPQPLMWEIIHATPEDRCRAAVMAAEEE